jgi:Zn-dependent protease with chaperone function
MISISKFLDDKKTIKENFTFFDSLSVSAAIYALFTTVMIIQAKNITKNLIVDKYYSKKLSDILKEPYTVKIAKVIGGPNAFAINVFNNNEVFCTSKLRQIFPEKEIIAILLHEVGHTKQKSRMYIDYVSETSLLSILLFFISKWSLTDIPGKIVIGFSLIFRSVLYHLSSAFISRQYEYDADSFAVKYGYGKYLKNALLRLHNIQEKDLKECQTILCKISRFLNEIFSSHPDLSKRLKAILEKLSNSNSLPSLSSENMYDKLTRIFEPNQYVFPSINSVINNKFNSLD